MKITSVHSHQLDVTQEELQCIYKCLLHPDREKVTGFMANLATDLAVACEEALGGY